MLDGVWRIRRSGAFPDFARSNSSTFKSPGCPTRPACRDTSSTRRVRALLADAGSLGVEAHVRLTDDLSSLFQPTTIAGRRVGNRLAIHPMEGCDAEPDGSPGELTFRRFRRFGAGGAKLIWGEACAVVPEGRANPRQLVINENNLAAISQLVAGGPIRPRRGVRPRR